MANELLKKVQTAIVPEELTDVFEAPEGRGTLVEIFVCNRRNIATTFRLALAPDGEDDELRHYIHYDAELPANETFSPKTWTLDQGDVVRCYVPADAEVSVTVMPNESQVLKRL